MFEKKSKRKIMQIFFAILLGSFCFLFMGCGEKKDSQTKTLGGEDTTEITLIWSGLTDYDFSYELTSYDYDEIFVTDTDGLTYEVSVNDSNVKYGTAGNYEVEFSANNEIKKKKVTIYAKPQINAPEKISLTYEQAIDDRNEESIYNKVTASDCFGNTLIVGIDGGILNSFYSTDGSVNYGKKDIVFAAVDKAGQIVEAVVEITVEKNIEITPETEQAEYTVDVSDDTISFVADLKGKELALVSVNGKILETNAYKYDIENKTFVVKLLDLKSELSILRIATVGGYVETEINFENKKPVLVNNYGKGNYSAVIDSRIEIEYPELICAKQNANFKVELTAPDNEVSNLNEKFFTADIQKLERHKYH